MKLTFVYIMLEIYIRLRFVYIILETYVILNLYVYIHKQIHEYIRSAGNILSYDQRFIVVFKSVLCPQNADCPHRS